MHDTIHFSVVAQVLPGPRPTINGLLVDVLLPRALAEDGPLRRLLAARLAHVDVQSYIPYASTAPTDAHQLAVAGGALDDDGPAYLDVLGEQPLPSFTDQTQFDLFAQTHARVGVLAAHSDSVTWLSPSFTPPTPDTHSLPHPAPPAPAPFPPPLTSSLDDRLAYFRAAVNVSSDVAEADRQALLLLLSDFFSLLLRALLSRARSPLSVNFKGKRLAALLY